MEEEPLTFRDLLKVIVGVVVVLFVGSTILVLGYHYIPWFDSKVARAFGEPTKTPVPLLTREVESPTPSPTPRIEHWR